MKIGILPLVFVCASFALVSCGAERPTKTEAPREGVTSVSSDKDVPVTVSGKVSEF